MNDNTTTIAMLKELFAQFVKEREWEQFHSPKNLSMNLACEAAELMEIFRWVESKESKHELQLKREAVCDELCDIALTLLLICEHNNIDLSQAIEHKMAKTRIKYPVEKAKGLRNKYTDYDRN